MAPIYAQDCWMETFSAALPCIHLHSCMLISFWSFLLHFADFKQTESALFVILLSGRMCSNGIPICPLSSTVVLIPSGGDRFAWNDFLIFAPLKMWILKQTADWICLQGSWNVADFFSLPLNLLMFP